MTIYGSLPWDHPQPYGVHVTIYNHVARGRFQLKAGQHYKWSSNAFASFVGDTRIKLLMFSGTGTYLRVLLGGPVCIPARIRVHC